MMRDRWGRSSVPRIVWLALGVSIGFLLATMLGAHAHDHNRPELSDWYKSLRTNSGPCCDGSDSKAVEDPDWESVGGRYRVRIDGKWIDVPPSSVLPGPNKDGRTMVWPYDSNEGVQVRCFLRGVEM